MSLQLDPKRDAALIKKLTGASSTPAKRRKRPRDARPELPRAPMGQGDHLAALGRLSGLGWHAYQCQNGQHFFSKLDGTLGPMAAAYEEAIRMTEALSKAQ